MYITTNKTQSTLYTGVTNNLSQRIIEHYINRGTPKSFAGKYHCYNLLYFEIFQYVEDAIRREKQIKGYSRQKKLELIKNENPKFIFQNADVLGCWPPKENQQK